MLDHQSTHLSKVYGQLADDVGILLGAQHVEGDAALASGRANEEVENVDDGLVRRFLFQIPVEPVVERILQRFRRSVKICQKFCKCRIVLSNEKVRPT